MSTLIFECKKCGTCCRNLFRDSQGVRKGLILTDREAELFPSKMISPHLGIGMKEFEELIVIYQLNVRDCPLLSQESRCTVYGMRPLMCRVFPYDPISHNLSVECPTISNQFVGLLHPSVFESFITEVEASRKMDRYLLKRFKKHFKKGIKVWYYDLTTRKWVFRAQHFQMPKAVSLI